MHIDWKRSVFIPVQKKGNAEECSDYHRIGLISYASKVMLKILPARLQRHLNWELPDVQAGFRKSQRNQRSNCQHPLDHRKIGNSRKTPTPASLTLLKLLTVWITTNCGKFFKRWEYQTTLPASLETCMQIERQQLQPDMGQWIGTKLGTAIYRL